MKIPSTRTLHDMELAAELRAAGATWETIGELGPPGTSPILVSTNAKQ